MLPYSIVNSLEIYKTLPTNKYVFEGQFAGNIVQEARNRWCVLLLKIRLEATVHTLDTVLHTLTRERHWYTYIQNSWGHASIKTTTIYTHVSKMATDKISSPLDRLVDVNNKKNLVIKKNIKR
jgi:integrase